MMERRGHWMLTFTGRKVYPDAPRLEDVDVSDIAHALSLQCRFNGHTPEFYSVAQHSVMIADEMASDGHPAGAVLLGLLHDAAEAYIGDLIWPLKHCGLLDGFKEIEDRWERVIAEKFGLDYEAYGALVKLYDLRALATEKRDLMHAASDGSPSVEVAAARERLGPWHSDGVEPFASHITPQPSVQARNTFAMRFGYWMSERGP